MSLFLSFFLLLSFTLLYLGWMENYILYVTLAKLIENSDSSADQDECSPRRAEHHT